MMKRASLFLFAIAAVGSFSARAASVVDGTFSGWSLGSVGFNGGTATVTVESSGGNPGANLSLQTVTNGGSETSYGTAIDSNYSTTAALSGSFSLNIDVLEGAGDDGEGQALVLLVSQGGSVYSDFLGDTFVPAGWTTQTYSGTFNAADFSLLSGTGPASPVFTGGTQTYFGFAGGNSGSGSLTQYYDNFDLNSPALTSPTSTPEPSTGLAVLCAFIGMGARFAYSRRRVAGR
jgi:hypothetical protein